MVGNPRLTRQQIGEFIGSQRGVRAFEDLQSSNADAIEQIAGASFLTLGSEPALGSERIFAPDPTDLIGDDGGANGIYSLGLAKVMTPGTYGDDNTYPVVTVDAKGRITGVSTRTSFTGTVTSVAASGGTTGLSFTGSPITTSGTLTLSGTLVVANGGTGATTLTGYVKGNGTAAFTAAATIPGADVSGNIAGNAANVTGVVARANGGTGLSAAPTNGQMLIGNGADYTLATLTAGTGISIANAAGSVTVSLASAYGDSINPYGSKTANFVLAAPNGAAGVPTFRAIVAADIPTLNQNTTGSAATLTTPRAIYGSNFDGSAALTGIIASTYGGTGNGFAKFSGPATSEKTFTLPNASANVLTDLFTGAVVQVVSATYSTQQSSASATYADTGLTATITPRSASNKILVLVSQANVAKDASNTGCNIILLRGATTISTLSIIAAYTNDTSANNIGSVSSSYLDSPATTSATTYKTQFASNSGTGTVYVQANGSTSTITLIEIVG